MVRVALVVMLAGCGRIHFDTHSDPIARYSFEGDPPLPVVVDDFAVHEGLCIGGACPTQVPDGYRGMGVNFDGNVDCVVIPDHEEFRAPRFTVALWMRPQTDRISTIIGKTVRPAANSWQLETDTGMRLAFSSLSAGVRDTMAADNAFTLDAWHHIAASFDGATKTLYVDGVRVASAATPSPLDYDDWRVSIGCDDDTTITIDHFDGRIDEVEIYDVALDSAAIAQLAAL